MSDKKYPTYCPPVDIPPTDHLGMATTPATPLVGTTSEEEFDSNNNPDTECYRPTSFSRPPGPRKSTSTKSTPIPVRQNFSASASTAGTKSACAAPSNSPALLEDGGDDDKELPQRKKRPHSGHISHGSMTFDELAHEPFDELAQKLATVTDERNQLIKLNSTLEGKSEADTVLIEQLQDALDAARTAKNSLMPRTVKAHKELTDLQQNHQELLSKNAELERQNKIWKREKAQAQSREERCHLLNQSMTNQIEMLKETVFRNESRIGQLKEENANLRKERDEAAAEAQRARDDESFLASWNESCQELRDENSALKREFEAVRIHLERMQEDQDSLEEDLWNLVSPSVSSASAQGTWTSTLNGQAPRGRTSNHNLGLTRLDSPIRKENPVLDSTYVDTGVQIEPKSPENQVEKLPYVDIAVQTSPREVFELMKPVTTIGERDVILQPTTYIDPGKQPSLTENVDHRDGSAIQSSAMLDENTALLSPSVHVDVGTQNDPEHVEDLQNILSEDPAVFPTSKSSANTRGLLRTASDNPAQNPPNTAKEKRQGAFDCWPLKSDRKPIYKFVGPHPRDLYPEMYGSGEALPIPEVIFTSSDPVVQDSDFEDAENKDAQDTTATELQSLPLGIWSQRSTIFETDMSDLSQTQNAHTQTNESGVTSKLPYRLEMDFEQNAPRKEAEAKYTSTTLKPGWPIWYRVVGLLIMVFLTHAFFDEKRFWRNANELTRRAVVSMRDERRGSEWVERIGYTLDLRLGVDRTGFC